MKCVIYVQIKDLEDWHIYLTNKKYTSTPPPSFRTQKNIDVGFEDEWIQILISSEELISIYDIIEYKNLNQNEKNETI